MICVILGPHKQPSLKRESQVSPIPPHCTATLRSFKGVAIMHVWNLHSLQNLTTTPIQLLLTAILQSKWGLGTFVCVGACSGGPLWDKSNMKPDFKF